MARIRTIKPEFFTSFDIVSLSPLARILYIATWCEADKEGRLVWSPATFKLRYLPGDSCDINALCDELTDRGLVVLYGNGLAYVPNFKAHQHVNPRESESQLPEPTRGARVATRQPRVVNAQGGREGKGRNNPHTPKGGEVHGFPPGFDRFWAAYPKKVGKDAAAKAFAKRKPNDDLLAAMLAAVERQRTSPAWTKDGGQFIPNPATWLNQGRWQDEEPEAGSVDPALADLFRRGQG